MVSEMMLQQTQVDRVRGKYSEFLKKFPSFKSLARASSRAVLRMWQGLGYNRRALALHRLAKIVVEKHRGKLPHTPETLIELPGIGPATAGSIAAFAFNIPAIFIETNIRRAIIHHFFPRRRRVFEKEIIAVAEAALDKRRPREWYWALMDYGSMLGKAIENPNRRSAQYRVQSRFAGSDRELRGCIVRVLTEKSRAPLAALRAFAGGSEARLRKALSALEREGFLRQKKGVVMIVE
jgi:A/G-specific adenine glycosylase